MRGLLKFCMCAFVRLCDIFLLFLYIRFLWVQLTTSEWNMDSQRRRKRRNHSVFEILNIGAVNQLLVCFGQNYLSRPVSQHMPCILYSRPFLWYSRYLGVLGTSGGLSRDTRQIANPTEKCDNSPYLEPRQRELCAKEKKLIDVIGAGASMGIEECKYQFRGRRWNCTTFNSTDVFGNVIKISKFTERPTMAFPFCQNIDWKLSVIPKNRNETNKSNNKTRRERSLKSFNYNSIQILTKDNW